MVPTHPRRKACCDRPGVFLRPVWRDQERAGPPGDERAPLHREGPHGRAASNTFGLLYERILEVPGGVRACR